MFFTEADPPFLVCYFFLTEGGAKASSEIMNLDKLSLRMAESTVTYFKPGEMKWHYQDGLVVMSVLKVAQHYGRQDLIDWAISMYEPLIQEDGTINTYRQGEYNLDQINAGRSLFDFYEITGKEKYKLAIENLKKQLETQPRTKLGVYWHKEIYPWQVWLDGLYMQGPFNTMAGGFLDAATQLIKTYERLKDEKTGLLYHAWDESRGQRWSDEKTGLSPHFWSRSIGWYVMSALDCLKLAPAGFDDEKAKLKQIVKNLLEALRPFQSKDGLWYQIPDIPEDKGNYQETSGTSMFAYGGFKASRMGITDEFVPMAQKALEGIVNMYLSEDEKGVLHLGGICSVAGLGGNPYRDGSAKYYYCEPVVTDDFKGTGPFILACLEHEKKGC